jgi:hypothetical protein
MDLERATLLRAPPSSIEEDPDARVGRAGLDDGDGAGRKLGLCVAPLGEPRLRKRRPDALTRQQRKPREHLGDRTILLQPVPERLLRVEGDRAHRPPYGVEGPASMVRIAGRRVVERHRPGVLTAC